MATCTACDHKHLLVCDNCGKENHWEELDESHVQCHCGAKFEWALCPECKAKVMSKFFKVPTEKEIQELRKRKKKQKRKNIIWMIVWAWILIFGVAKVITVLTPDDWETIHPYWQEAKKRAIEEGVSTGNLEDTLTNAYGFLNSMCRVRLEWDDDRCKNAVLSFKSEIEKQNK